MTGIRKTCAFFFALLFVLLPLAGRSGSRAYDGAAEAAAQELYDLGLFQGVGKDEKGAPIFDLDRTPTRFEAVTMLVRLLGKEAEANAASYSAPFQDVQDWAKPYVNYAYRHGLTSGTSEKTYSGGDATTATQYLTFVLRALGYVSGEDFSWDKAWELTDTLGITSGQYNAKSSFTRGDVAVISANALSAQMKGSARTLREAMFSDPVLPADSSFEIHFIDVGEADAALILCDGHAMMIDGGNAGDSDRIYTYLKNHGVTRLDAVICSHPHEDHVGGLSGALHYAVTERAYCSVTEYDTRAFESFAACLAEQGVSITVPKPGDSFALGSASVAFAGPVRGGDSDNNGSLVVRIEYGDTSFLFTGDAEREEELEILEAGYPIRSTLLKVPHHGSDTSSTYPFLYEVEAQYAVIPTGEDNPYGHPSEDTLSRLRDADVKIYRTDLDGDILCRSDGKTLTFETSGPHRHASGSGGTSSGQGDSRDIPVPTDRSGGEHTYVLNTNTGKFHYPDCSSVSRMSEKNKATFTGTREELIAKGFDPCGNCKP